MTTTRFAQPLPSLTMTPQTSDEGQAPEEWPSPDEVRRPTLLISVGILVVTAMLVLAVRQWVVTPYRIDSTSMAPTITPGSTVFVAHAGLLWGDPGIQDIVAFDGAGGPMLKRVVGVAGDRVAIVDAVLHRNGVPVDEPYVDTRSLDGVFFGPVTVPDGHLFVMGDNRFPSIDSRTFGPVPVEEVTGRVLDPFRALTVRLGPG